MIKLENTEVVGQEHAIRGARNPMNSSKIFAKNTYPIMKEKDTFEQQDVFK